MILDPRSSPPAALVQGLCHLCSSLAEQFDGYYRRVKGLPLEAMGGVEKNNISTGRVEIQLWEKYFWKCSTENKLLLKRSRCVCGSEVIPVEGSGWLLAPTPPEFNWPPPSKWNKNDALRYFTQQLYDIHQTCIHLTRPPPHRV